MRSKKVPTWMNRALPGVCYWIAHRRALYRNHPLPEAALVAELCNLIHANIGEEYLLKCEVMLKELFKTAPKDIGKERADLVIYKLRKDKMEVLEYIIEVKRSSSSNQKIDADLNRLSLLKSQLPNVRTFLVIIAEKSRPKKFVNENGKSIRTRVDLGNKCSYSVIFTWKSLFGISPSSLDRGHYACLIEVLSND